MRQVGRSQIIKASNDIPKCLDFILYVLESHWFLSQRIKSFRIIPLMAEE